MKEMKMLIDRSMAVQIAFITLIVMGFLGCDSTQQIDFIGTMKEHLGVLMDEQVAIDPSLSSIETDGGEVYTEIYQAEKIKRVVFNSIHIIERGVYEESVFVYPADGYDFPVLWITLNRDTKYNMILLIADFIPLQDILMKPDYAEKYLEPLNEARANVLDILEGATTSLEVPFKTAYAFSPYKTVIVIAEYAMGNLSDVLNEYCETYIAGVEGAEMLEEGSADREYAAERVNAFLALLKANDPGYDVMVDAFGQETTDAVFDIVF